MALGFRGVILAGVFTMLASCGGGEPALWSAPVVPIAQANAGAKDLAASAPLRAAQVDPWGGVAALYMTEQLLNFGESSYSRYFPSHQATQVFQQFRYRFYPETGCYLGVDQTVDVAGVYVMGCSFGNAPTAVGHVLNFVPVNTAVSATVLLWDKKSTIVVNGIPIPATNNTPYAVLKCVLLPESDGVVGYAQIIELCFAGDSDIVEPKIMVHDLKNNVLTVYDGPPLPSGYEMSRNFGWTFGWKWHSCQAKQPTCYRLGPTGTPPVEIPQASAWAPKLDGSGAMTGWLYTTGEPWQLYDTTRTDGPTFSPPPSSAYAFYNGYAIMLTMYCDASGTCSMRTD